MSQPQQQTSVKAHIVSILLSQGVRSQDNVLLPRIQACGPLSMHLEPDSKSLHRLSSLALPSKELGSYRGSGQEVLSSDN